MRKLLPLLVLLAACGDTTPRRETQTTIDQPSRSSIQLAPGDSLVCRLCVLASVDTSIVVERVDTTFGSQVDTTWRDSTVTPPPPPPVDTAPPPVDTTTPPPPPVTGLPPGFSLIGLQDCTQRKPSGWTDRGDAALSVFMDPVRGAVCRATYRVGFGGGRGPVNIGHNFSKSNAAFASFWIKVSPAWEGHPSGVNKVLHFWNCAGGQCGNKLTLSATGIGTGPLQAQVRLQGMACEAKISRNLRGSQYLKRGQWHRWDVRVSGNSAGQSNGTVQWWLDGKPAGLYTNLCYNVSATTFNRVEWAPTWGGVGGRTVALMQMDIDDWLIAVGP